ncbi:MAG: hypothetical protein EAZ53_04810 [Bacteroidetes bacterium]|nr:MAG: hypothetical protein EAZ53_04810 [Bacteroidota bacterium]
MLFCSKKQYICPAYTTYFIHDQKERDKVFMPFVEDSLKESTSATDTDDTLANKNIKSNESGKFQLKTSNPKDKSGKKYQVNGLVTASKTSKTKARNVSEIEMKVISIKGTALFSGIDSTSKEPQVETPIKEEVAPTDTTQK